MITETIEWFKPSEKLPEEGFHLIALLEAQEIAAVSYSEGEWDLNYYMGRHFKNEHVKAWAYIEGPIE